MAVVITEAENSREQEWGTNPSATLEYFISGTDDEAEADAALKASLATYRGLWANSYRLIPHAYDADGFRIFQAVVTYGPIPGGLTSGDEGDAPSFTAEFSTESTTIQQGLAVVNTYTPSGITAVNFNGAINVTSDGVQGVEIQIPVQQFSLTISILTSNFTTGYQASVARLCGSVNNHTWRGFAVKEVLFLGMSATGVFGERTTLTYRFAVSPNVTGLSIGGITGIEKAGWDYLWCFYRDETDDTAKMLIKKPAQVTVNQVYPLGNFMALGLGG